MIEVFMQAAVFCDIRQRRQTTVSIKSAAKESD